MSHDIATHMLTLAKHLYEGGAVNAKWIQDNLAVSRPTAYRYMMRLECTLPVLEHREPTGAAGRNTRRVLHLMNQ